MKKKSGFFVIFWFLILLPGLRIFLSDLFVREPDFRQYSETAEELGFVIEREQASFPDDFLATPSRWEGAAGQWRADWHVYEPYLSQSMEELDNLVISSPLTAPGKGGGGKKKKGGGQISSQDFWAQVYSFMGEKNSARVENISRAFLWYQEKNDLTDRELLNLVIQFVQQIPYELPENLYGLYTPTEILKLNAGDCDSKSVFAAILLRDLGYDVAIFYSSEYRHAMLGVNAAATGVYKEMNGRTYYFTEMTAPGWQIGDLPPDCSDPDFWYISQL